MIRCGLPLGLVVFILIASWAIFAVLIGVYVPKLKGQHVKIALRSLGAAVLSFIVIAVAINLIAIFFN